MIVAFCLYKYFPFGGLQRDFMRIAQTVAARGHHVRVYAQSWEGECPDVFELIKVPVKSHTNHGRNAGILLGCKNIYVNIPSIELLDSTKCRGWTFIMPLMFVMPRK